MPKLDIRCNNIFITYGYKAGNKFSMQSEKTVPVRTNKLTTEVFECPPRNSWFRKHSGVRVSDNKIEFLML